MDKLINDFSVGLFFWQTLLFLLLLFVLRKFAWKPILKAVEDREQGIEEALKAAQNARAEMQNLQADNERVLREARAERDAILKEAREIKDKTIAEAKGAAKEEAEKIISSARAQIENEKMAAITELKNQVADLSIDIAERILRSELKDEARQRELVGQVLQDTKLN